MSTQITNLVFEGGGVRGIAFCGAIKKLEECGVLGIGNPVTRIIGSSAGSMAATAVAIGYTSNELEKIFRETDFRDFQDSSFGIVRNVTRLFRKFGYYKGDALEKWLRKLIAAKTGNGDMTFQELYNEKGIELTITGTSLSRRRTVYYNMHTTPDMKLYVANRISSSIPGYYACVTLKGEDGKRDVLVDGGVLNNYPIHYFDDKTSEREQTLGLKLMGSDEQVSEHLYHGYNEINNVADYISELINSLFIQLDRAHIDEQYWKRTIPINTFEVKTTEFNMSKKVQDKLIQSGYDCTEHYFQELTNARHGPPKQV